MAVKIFFYDGEVCSMNIARIHLTLYQLLIVLMTHWHMYCYFLTVLITGTLFFIFKTLQRDAVKIWRWLYWFTIHTSFFCGQTQLSHLYVVDFYSNNTWSISTAHLSPKDGDILASIKNLIEQQVTYYYADNFQIQVAPKTNGCSLS